MIEDKTGADVPLKISKVLAGLEADKTNGLLQELAKAIEQHQEEGGGAPPAAKKGGAGAAKKPAGATKPGGKPATKQDATRRAAGGKPGEKKDAAGTKRTIRDASPANKPAAKQGKAVQETPGSGGTRKSKSKMAAPPIDPEQTVAETSVKDETIANEQEERGSKRMTRKESSAELTKRQNDFDNNPPADESKEFLNK